jgi:hypothetical protein
MPASAPDTSAPPTEEQPLPAVDKVHESPAEGNATGNG